MIQSEISRWKFTTGTGEILNIRIMFGTSPILANNWYCTCPVFVHTVLVKKSLQKEKCSVNWTSTKSTVIKDT